MISALETCTRVAWSARQQLSVRVIRVDGCEYKLELASLGSDIAVTGKDDRVSMSTRTKVGKGSCNVTAVDERVQPSGFH